MRFQNNTNESNRAQQWGMWIRNWGVIYQMFDGKINLMELFILVANCDSLKRFIFYSFKVKSKVSKSSQLTCLLVG